MSELLAFPNDGSCEVLPPAALVPAPQSVLIIARPHPFSSDVVWANIPAGLTLAAIIGPEAMTVRIEIAGQEIPRAWWPYVKPKPGTIVHITRFPQGGGGGGWKMIFRLVAFAALAVLTYGIAEAGAIQSLLPEFIQGLSAGAAAATAAVVGLGGALLINALIPPAATGVGQQTSPAQLQGISGIQNSMDPYGAITCVFGTMINYAKLAAKSYTELDGNDQYLISLMDLGYGSLSISQMMIGSDLLSNFTGVNYEIGAAPSLYPNDVSETAASAELDDDGDSAQRSTSASADEGSVDIIYPSGLFGVDADSGDSIAVTCSVKIEYEFLDNDSQPGTGVSYVPLQNPGRYSGEPIGASVTFSGDGSGAAAYADCGIIGANGPNSFFYGVRGIYITNPGSGYTTISATLTVFGGTVIIPAAIGTPHLGATYGAWFNAMSATGLTISNSSATSDGTLLNITSSAKETLRIGVRWKFPQRGQYIVKVTRVGTDWNGATDNNRSGDMIWNTLRTIRYAPPSTTPTTKLALRIKATDQLNGTISDFNILEAQIIPAWDGTAWTPTQTSNPAWIFRWLLCDCPANPRRVDYSKINDDEIKDWGADCAARGLTFDYVNSNVTTVFELIKIICAAGRASFTVVDSKYSVVRDIPQTVPIQIFTPRNTSGFSGTRTFAEEVHALRVQFINPQAQYQQDELVVYDDHYDASNATKFEQLQIPGCANAPEAWKLGRYHLAVNRLRQNTYSWNADIEHLICNRGDLVLFASDVVSVGLGWGRIKAITLDGSGNVKQVITDEAIDVRDAAPTYAIRIRCQDGSVKVSTVTFDAGSNVNAFNLVTPLPGVNGGDLFLFGIQNQDSIPMVVSKIEPTTDLAAKITAVDAAQDVLTADAGYIDAAGTYHEGLPPLISSITGDVWSYDETVPTFTPIPTYSGSGDPPSITGSY